MIGAMHIQGYCGNRQHSLPLCFKQQERKKYTRSACDADRSTQQQPQLKNAFKCRVIKKTSYNSCESHMYVVQVQVPSSMYQYPDFLVDIRIAS